MRSIGIILTIIGGVLLYLAMSGKVSDAMSALISGQVPELSTEDKSMLKPGTEPQESGELNEDEKKKPSVIDGGGTTA